MYVSVTVISALTDTPPLAVSKYLPMITVTLPLAVYLGLQQVFNPTVAIYAGYAVAANRTLLLFESKFIEESLAMVALFFIIYSLLSDENRLSRAICPIFILFVAITHHFTSVLAILYIALVCVSNWEPLFPSSITEMRSNREIRYSTVLLLLFSGVLVVTVFAFLSRLFTTTLVGEVIRNIQGQSFTQSSGSLGSNPTIRGMIASLALPILIVCSGITAAGFFSRQYRFSNREVLLTVASGVLALIYAVFQFVGGVVNIDPIRLLIVLLPLLTAITCQILLNYDTEIISPRLQSIVPAVIVIILIITQIAAIPPTVLYTDPGETAIGDDHYTESQFSASSWAGRYLSSPVYAYEAGLWLSEPNNEYRSILSETEERSGVTVWRDGVSKKRINVESVIYDVGTQRLYI
ncbi:hypothetical protein ACOJIV_15910 [Haloarcula sp. AONF1]